MARGRKKARAADIKRRLIDDGREASPFASIRLVEKKEVQGKQPQAKPVPRKPSEIVQGYDPSSSFADILYAYEHTGNPYALPSRSRKHEIAASNTDFGAILANWEGRTSGGGEKARKKASAERKSQAYRPTKSFGDILAEFDGKGVEKAGGLPEEKVEDLPDDAPLFRKEGEDGRRAPEAAWSIFGGNEAFARKEPEKEDAKEDRTERPAARASAPYKATRSFADILSDYEDGQRARSVASPGEAAPRTVKEPDEAPLSDNLFKEESDDEKRSPDAVWSVFGNNRIPDRRKDAEEVRPDAAQPAPAASQRYQPSASFSSILSQYERKSDLTFDEIMKAKGDSGSRRPQLTISRLRSMPPQATLDLHGFTAREAEDRVRAFLAECRENGIRKISIITGKGLHSEDGVGVLRDTVMAVLDGSGAVSECCNAPVSAGGSGALWIILKA